MKKIFIYLFLAFSLFSFSQVKEDVYLVFVSGVESTVNYSPRRDGRDKTARQYDPKFQFGCFVFYKDFFQVVPNSKIEFIKLEDARKFKIITIDDFLRTRETNEKTQLSNPNALFNNIFILVPDTRGDYFKFEVDWKEVFID